MTHAPGLAEPNVIARSGSSYRREAKCLPGICVSADCPNRPPLPCKRLIRALSALAEAAPSIGNRPPRGAGSPGDRRARPPVGGSAIFQSAARVVVATAFLITILTGSHAMADEAPPPAATHFATNEGPASDNRPVSPAGNDIVRRSRRSVEQRNESGDAVASRVSRGSPGLFRASDVLWPLALLGILVALSVIVKRLSRRGGATAAGNPVIEVLARTALSPRQNLCLVRLGRRVVLLGVGGDQARTLVEINDPVEAAELIGAAAQARPGSISSQFSEFLRSAAAGFRETPPHEANRTADGGGSASDRPNVDSRFTARSELHRVTEQLRSLKLRGAGVTSGIADG